VAGNRAVSRLVAGAPARPEQVLARKLKKVKIQAPTAAETAILHAVDAYNPFHEQEAAAADRALPRAAGDRPPDLHVVRATPASDLMTLPSAVPMRELLRSSEEERDEIVDHLRGLKTGASLPFASLQPGEAAPTWPQCGPRSAPARAT
jgi:hypothetical protein